MVLIPAYLCGRLSFVDMLPMSFRVHLNPAFPCTLSGCESYHSFPHPFTYGNVDRQACWRHKNWRRRDHGSIVQLFITHSRKSQEVRENPCTSQGGSFCCKISVV